MTRGAIEGLICLCRLEYATDGTGMHAQSCEGIIISPLEEVKIFHQDAYMNIKDWKPLFSLFMAERKLLFKHMLVVLLGSFCPGVSDFPGSFFSDAIPGTYGDMSFQAVSWMLFMTFGIGSLVVTFHRSD